MVLGETRGIIAAEIDVIERVVARIGLWSQWDLVAVGVVELGPAVDMKTVWGAPPSTAQTVMGRLDRWRGHEALVEQFDKGAGQVVPNIDGEQFHRAVASSCDVG